VSLSALSGALADWALMANATWVAPSVGGREAVPAALSTSQLENLNHGGHELSFKPPSSPAGQTSKGVDADACTSSGAVVGWSPTVSQSPPDRSTPDTVNVRVPKGGSVVVVGGVVVVVVVVT
jgi:hypothetical protein